MDADFSGFTSDPGQLTVGMKIDMSLGTSQM